MIKKISLLVCIISCSWHLMSAQSDDYQRIRIGLKVSPSLAWMKSNTKNVVGNGSKLGFSYGLMADFYFTKNYAIGTGLDVCYRGGKLKDRSHSVDPFSDREAIYNLQYLQLPFTIKLRTNEIGYLTYFGQLGLETGFNLKATGTDLEAYPLPSTNKENIRSQVIPFNLALLLQAGIEYSLAGHTSLMVSVYFSNGFIDVLRTVTPNIDGRSNGLGLNVGIFF